MGISFAHPVALWALLGLPVVVLIHFLQSRERKEHVSTLFLLDLLPEETRKGAVFTRLLAGPQLWLQLLTVLFLTLLLARPMWLRSESVQTVAVVVDVSASMRAFREETKTELSGLFQRLEGTAGTTEWLLLPSDITQPRIYRGTDTAEALFAVESLSLTAGPHPNRTALIQARRLIGEEGGLILLTDRPEDNLPADAVTLGVGQPKPNHGIAGIRLGKKENGEWEWEAVLTHASSSPTLTSLTVRADGQELSSQEVQILPDGLGRVSGRLPPGTRQGLLQLGDDAFDLDNLYPFVLPEPPPLPVSLDVPEDTAAWAEKVLTTVEGASRVATGEQVAWREVGNVLPLASAPHEILQRTGGPTGKYQRPVAVPHPLTQDLVWSSLVVIPRERTRISGETVLIWMGDIPLVSLLGDNMQTRLLLNFDLKDSNADRHPGMVMLLHRHLRALQNRQTLTRTENLGTAQRVDDFPTFGTEWITRFRRPEGDETTRSVSSPPRRAPDTPGWWTVGRPEVESPLLQAGVAFLHPEESDLRQARPRTLPADWIAGRRERNSEQDFLRPLWFLLLAGSVVGSWWAGSRGGVR